jgi:hypothetical protein
MLDVTNRVANFRFCEYLQEYVRASWSICLAMFFYCWLVFFIGCCSCCMNIFGKDELPPQQQPIANGQPQSNPIAYNNSATPYATATPIYYQPQQPAVVDPIHYSTASAPAYDVNKGV